MGNCIHFSPSNTIPIPIPIIDDKSSPKSNKPPPLYLEMGYNPKIERIVKQLDYCEYMRVLTIFECSNSEDSLDTLGDDPITTHNNDKQNDENTTITMSEWNSNSSRSNKHSTRPI